MRLRFLFFFTLVGLMWGTASDKPVDRATARTVASHFFATRYNLTPESLTPQVAYAATPLRDGKGSTPSFYVVNFNTDGFVIVAGDDRVQPILAFSDEGAFVAENMPDQLTAANHPDSCVEAVATLLYHCGVAVNMNYGPAASVCNSNRIVSALSTYFRYPTTVQYIERGSLSTTAWLNYLKGELDEGAPFMYGGSGNYGGHVWTCDGYRDDNYFHFNWGWGGQQNGYYALTNCSSYGFNSNHAIIIGIRGPELPDAIGEHNMMNLKVFPNPSNGIVYVSAESQPVSELQVFDIFGKMLFHKSIDDREFSVDLSDYSAGTYILRFITDSGVGTHKIVIY